MPTYRITINGNQYTVAVPNPHERPVRAIVNGETIEVDVGNETAPIDFDTPTRPAPTVSAITKPATQQITPAVAINTRGTTGEVKSPLPGIIVSITVTEGDRVERGQELCVLEAMKMNNPIRSTTSGIVTKIFISIGQQVQHGVPLMTIKE